MTLTDTAEYFRLLEGVPRGRSTGDGGSGVSDVVVDDDDDWSVVVAQTWLQHLGPAVVVVLENTVAC
jgi:hypothetical protein